MKIDRFEDIIAWQKAKDLTLTIYKSFKDIKDFSFRDQIQRASVSIMNNTLPCEIVSGIFYVLHICSKKPC